MALRRHFAERVERETGFEPATSTLARLHSTTELLPLNRERHVPVASRPVKRFARGSGTIPQDPFPAFSAGAIDCMEIFQAYRFSRKFFRKRA